MKLNEINIRYPFILPVDGTYYMYGTRGADCWGIGSGFDVYKSQDLETWSEPIEVFKKTPDFPCDRNFWAPEVHVIDGAFYMFASFKADDRERGTYILKSESPEGPFTLWSDGAITPREWSCLDGTYFEENGKRYMVFCHEWTQIHDGEICAVEMTHDLKRAAGSPVTLCKGSDMYGAEKDTENFVTDGPFLVKKDDGLLMLWSSFSNHTYRVALAESDSLLGKWTQQQRYLFPDDGGHGMAFTGFDGKTYFTMHSPNETPKERPLIRRVDLR